MKRWSDTLTEGDVLTLGSMVCVVVGVDRGIAKVLWLQDPSRTGKVTEHVAHAFETAFQRWERFACQGDRGTL